MSLFQGSVEIRGLTEKFSFNPKEGIDNPVMVIETELMATPNPHLCVLKREEGESYGFHLRVEKGQQGHIIRNVVSGGVAACSGLQDGDRLLEVNNCYVDDFSHSEVARKIKLSGNQLCLLVLDGEAYQQAVAKGQDLRDLARVNKDKNCKPPRLCHIIRDPVTGLGLNFQAIEGERGRFTVNVVPGGAAEKAGVRKGDHLVWMDGATVSDLSHSALSRMVKKSGDHITILVIDSESEKCYMRDRMPILPTIAVSHRLPHRATKINLACGPQGYGFLLRLERTPSGRTYHILRELDNDSPAEKAGIRDGDLLLEVNGESVESLMHNEIVNRVKLSGQQVSLTTIPLRGLEFYSKLGLSPLLFCEEDAEQREKDICEPAPAAEEPPQKEMNAFPKSRFCSLKKGSLGFGFNLSYDPQKPGPFISEVTLGGPGQRAGLTVGDVVIEVNGQNVKDKCLEDVIMLMKKGDFLSLLVKDEQPDTQIKEITYEEDDDNYEITYL
ncbi:uncharacterized protein V6R79_000341 [Siganus canaliculatus]